MNFEYNTMQIGSLLKYENKQLYIPRYQRDYSWQKDEITEFMNDLLSEIIMDSDGNLITSEYFFGTILLSGSFTQSGKKLEVIDGQQRVTTMTIFLSALAKNYYSIGEEALGNNLWRYIMKEDVDGNIYKALKNETTNDYFQYLIQMKEECKKISIDEEQDRIKFAYDYFMEILKEEKIKKKFKEVNKAIDIEKIDNLSILKAIRDQLLNSNVICISTRDTDSASSIFEILNGKGKKLESIDLIKNNIFRYLDGVEPTDDAKNIWKEIKCKLVSRKERVELPTFFRHYWISKYNKVKDDQLYDDFKYRIKEEKYKEFLEDLNSMADLYIKIICPNMEDYENRKQYGYIVESLNYLNNYFNIKQIRVLLLALFDLRNKGTLGNKKFKEILTYLHKFHFAYNALCTKRSNALEGKYSKFALKLNKTENKEQTNKVIDELIENLDISFPNYMEFEKEFIKLQYSKKSNSYNMLTKYVLNSIEKYYRDLDISPVDGSIEHILPEDRNNEYSLNIGNLILLEERINKKVEDKGFEEKIEVYSESAYKCIEIFREEYKNTISWNNSLIEERAKKISLFYYRNILGKEIKK